MNNLSTVYIVVTVVKIAISGCLVTLKALHLQLFFYINCPRNRKNLEWNEKSNCTCITCIYYNKPYFLNVQQLKNKKKTIIFLLTSSSNNKQGLYDNSSQQYQRSANNAQKDHHPFLTCVHTHDRSIIINTIISELSFPYIILTSFWKHLAAYQTQR